MPRLKQDLKDGSSQAVKKPHGVVLHRGEAEPLVELFCRIIFGVHDHGVDCHNVTGAHGSLDCIDKKVLVQIGLSER